MSNRLNTELERGLTSKEEPVIGIIATGETDDQVARVCLRALAKGHEVIINECGPNTDIGELSELPGVLVLESGPTDDELDEEHEYAIRELRVAARTKAVPGLVIVDDPTTPIDFRRSLEKLEGEPFACEATPKSAEAVRMLVAVPAYNEEGTIRTVVERASVYADEVVVVDDGSSDQTAPVAEAAGATVVSHERNRGYGAALKTAFETADRWAVECLVVIDGDGQHDIDDIPKLASMVLDEDAHVAIGSRFIGERASNIPRYRRVGLGVVNVLSNVSMGVFDPRSWIGDTQSGFRAYDDHAIAELAGVGLGDDMDASLDILYQLHGNGFEIQEVATVVNYDVDDGHSQNPVGHGLNLVQTILRTVERDHPIKLIGVPGSLIVFFGLVFGYATFQRYLLTQSFPLGMALASAFFVLLGVFLAFTAVVLHSLDTHLRDLRGE